MPLLLPAAAGEPVEVMENGTAGSRREFLIDEWSGVGCSLKLTMPFKGVAA